MERGDIPLVPIRALASGKHTVTLYVTDSLGRKLSRTTSFVTAVADLPYSATLLTATDATDSDAIDINENGESVGWTESAGVKRAVLWLPVGVPSFLDVSPSSAVAINNAGHVVGTAGPTPVLWAAGSRQVLHEEGTVPADINNSDVVALNTPSRDGILWQNGAFRVVTKGGCVISGVYNGICRIVRLNDNGQAVGPAITPHGEGVAAGLNLTVRIPMAPYANEPFVQADIGALNNAGFYAGKTFRGFPTVYLGSNGESRVLLAEFGDVWQETGIRST